MENKWAESERVLGTELTASLKKLFDFYGKNIYKWLASLYEPEIGAFYYSNSARDYEGFLPDIESTTQVLEMVQDTGMTNAFGGKIANAIPDSVRQKILAFSQGLQDPDDGFFYHPQWGKNIGQSRKGRDANSSYGVIHRMNGKPLYPTGIERLRNAAKEGTGAPTSVPEYMTDENKLKEYLSTLKVNYDSHGVGHMLESQGTQLKATGMIDKVCDWLDAHQQENGLWQPVTDRPYTALSGLLKIGSFYRIAERQMRHCDKMVDAAIDVVLCDEDPIYVILVYNPWGGLRYSLLNMRMANKNAAENGEPLPYDIEAVVEHIRKKAPAMIEKTIEKLKKFQKPDGSFSYEQQRSAPTTQGTPVSLGVYEGDVNGTALAMNTMSNTIFEVLGIARVPLYGEEEMAQFNEIILSNSVPDKKSVTSSNNTQK